MHQITSITVKYTFIEVRSAKINAIYSHIVYMLILGIREITPWQINGISETRGPTYFLVRFGKKFEIRIAKIMFA